MKKFAAIILVMIFLLSGCGEIKEAIDGFTNELSGVVEMTEDEIYGELKRLMANPDRMDNTDLVGQFSFVAVITSDIEELEFEDDEPGMYCSAEISREYDDYFLLELTNIEGTFSAGDIVKITGEVDGTIYWTENNDLVKVLAIKASAVEDYEPPEVELANAAAVEIDGNTIEFLGAHKSTDSFGEVIIVYINFTNNSDEAARPKMSSFFIEYNGYEAETSVFSVSEVDGSAVSITGAGITPETYPGKTLTYFMVFTGDETAAADEPIFFTIFDDEFRMTYDYGIYIAESLAELTGEAAD